MADTSIPPAYRPVIRVVRTAAGVDRKDYLQRLARALGPQVSDDGIRAMVDDMQGAPVSVLDADTEMKALTPGVATRVTALMKQADSTARAAFAGFPDPLVSSSCTLVDDHAALSFPAATVVWLRNGQQADLQLVMPRLGLDLATGQAVERPSLALRVIATPPPQVDDASGVGAMSFMAMPSDSDDTGTTILKVGQSALAVASSVSWALPPPWNIGVTAALSLVQVLMGLGAGSSGPSPMDQLKQDLENYMDKHQTETELGHIRLFSENLLIYTKPFGAYVPTQMPTGAEDKFNEWFNGIIGSDALENDVNDLIDRLEASDLDGGLDLLSAACSGITVWTTGQKANMQLVACRQATQVQSNDPAGYANANTSWQALLDEITERLFDLTDDTDPQKAVVQGFVSRVEKWIDDKRNARLAQIHPIERVQHWTTTQEGWGDLWGWRYVDNAETWDDAEWAHWVQDAEVQRDDKPCNTTTVEEKDQVQDAHDQHVTEVTSDLDSKTSTATTTLSALRQKVQDIAGLLPPAAPTGTLPTVTVHTAGTPTPAGLWEQGGTVSYQVVFWNDHGPSTPGPPTPPVSIDAFAGATVSNIPQSKDAVSIHLVRTIVPAAGGAGVVRNVKPVAAGTASVDDTAAG